LEVEKKGVTIFFKLMIISYLKNKRNGNFLVASDRQSSYKY
jgi:hypothetical protein